MNIKKKKKKSIVALRESDSGGLEVCNLKKKSYRSILFFLPPRNEIEEDKVMVQLEKIERCAERKQAREGRERERADE